MGFFNPCIMRFFNPCNDVIVSLIIDFYDFKSPMSVIESKLISHNNFSEDWVYASFMIKSIADNLIEIEYDCI